MHKHKNCTTDNGQRDSLAGPPLNKQGSGIGALQKGELTQAGRVSITPSGKILGTIFKSTTLR